MVQRKRINFISRLKNAENKRFCICRDIYKIHEGNDFDQIYEVSSKLKKGKLKINNILIEKKNKYMLENPDFEQDTYSITALGFYKIGHDSVRLVKWLAFYSREYDRNLNFYDLMISVLKCLNEMSQR